MLGRASIGHSCSAQSTYSSLAHLYKNCANLCAGKRPEQPTDNITTYKKLDTQYCSDSDTGQPRKGHRHLHSSHACINNITTLCVSLSLTGGNWMLFLMKAWALKRHCLRQCHVHRKYRAAGAPPVQHVYTTNAFAVTA